MLILVIYAVNLINSPFFYWDAQNSYRLKLDSIQMIIIFKQEELNKPILFLTFNNFKRYLAICLNIFKTERFFFFGFNLIILSCIFQVLGRDACISYFCGCFKKAFYYLVRIFTNKGWFFIIRGQVWRCIRVGKFYQPIKTDQFNLFRIKLSAWLFGLWRAFVYFLLGDCQERAQLYQSGFFNFMLFKQFLKQFSLQLCLFDIFCFKFQSLLLDSGPFGSNQLSCMQSASFMAQRKSLPSNFLE